MATELSTAPVSGELSIAQAFSAMTAPVSDDDKRDEAVTESPEREPATRPDEGDGAAQHESAAEADAGSDEEPIPGETEEPDPAHEPSIERPRSWAKEHDEAFKALPRHLQQMVVDSERARESEFLRRQQEVADAKKAHEADIAATTAARQQYEQALPLLLQTLQGEQAREFDDIKTWDDVAQMAATNPLRYGKWDALQKRSQAVQQEIAATQERQQQEAAQQFVTYTKEQEALFLKEAPEFADPKQAPAKFAEARAYLTGRGFTEGEIDAHWAGQPLSLRDSRVQLMVRDAMRMRAAEAKLKQPAPRQTMPVQRPGSAPAAADRESRVVRDLDKKLDADGKIDTAFALLKARKRSAAA